MSAKIPQHPMFNSFAGEKLTITAAAPLPPGSRVSFQLDLPGTLAPVPIQGKVLLATPLQVDTSQYRMTISLHTVRREEKARLLAAADMTNI